MYKILKRQFYSSNIYIIILDKIVNLKKLLNAQFRRNKQLRTWNIENRRKTNKSLLIFVRQKQLKVNII